MYLTYEEMEKLTTKRLLAYKKKHLAHDGSPDCSSYFHGFGCGDFGECPVCELRTNDAVEHYYAYKNIKEILSKREHVQ